MESTRVALFGEAEKGEFRTPYYFESLTQVADYLGNPPPHSQGLLYAVQVLMNDRALIYFRVKEEGFSLQDYFFGLHLLEQNGGQLNLAAICLPGVGNFEIIEAVGPICKICKSVMITSEPDLYDFLTEWRH